MSKLKKSLSAYLRKVRAGSSAVIYDRDVPIARLERIALTNLSSDRLKRMGMDGVTRPPLRELSDGMIRRIFKGPISRRSRLVEALEQDRSEGR